MENEGGADSYHKFCLRKDKSTAVWHWEEQVQWREQMIDIINNKGLQINFMRQPSEMTVEWNEMSTKQRSFAKSSAVPCPGFAVNNVLSWILHEASKVGKQMLRQDQNLEWKHKFLMCPTSKTCPFI